MRSEASFQSCLQRRFTNGEIFGTYEEQVVSLPKIDFGEGLLRHRCLDAGAGNGRMAHELCRAFETVDAVDIYDLMPADIPPNYKFHRGDVTTFVPSEKYNCIVASFLFGVMSDGDVTRFMSHCYDIIKHDGLIVVRDFVTFTSEGLDCPEEPFILRNYNNLYTLLNHQYPILITPSITRMAERDVCTYYIQRLSY